MLKIDRKLQFLIIKIACSKKLDRNYQNRIGI